MFSGKCIYLNKNKYALTYNTVGFLRHTVYDYDREYHSINGATLYIVHYKITVNGASKVQMNTGDFNRLFKDLGEFREERINKILDDNF